MISRHLVSLVEDPPKEDSADLSDIEVEQAVTTIDHIDLERRLVEMVRSKGGTMTIGSHELRRRGNDLYWRTRLVGEEPDCVLVFKTNWLGG